MSIQYAVVPNALQPGQYYPRPVHGQTLDIEHLIVEIEKQTAMTASDIAAVLRSFSDNVTKFLLIGHRVSINNLVDLSIRLSQVMNSPNADFDPQAGGELYVGATIKPQLTADIRTQATFEKVVAPPKFPLPVSLMDATTELEGQYTAGSIGKVVGKNLKIGDKTDPLQGIFFVAESDATQTKVTVIENNGDRDLTFEIPAGLTGNQFVEIRTRYTPTGNLRTGGLNDALTPA